MSAVRTYRARVGRTTVQVRLGNDGQVWTWTDRGQVTLASSRESRAWIGRHVVSADRADALLACVVGAERQPSLGDKVSQQRGRPRSRHTQPMEAML